MSKPKRAARHEASANAALVALRHEFARASDLHGPLPHAFAVAWGPEYLAHLMWWWFGAHGQMDDKAPERSDSCLRIHLLVSIPHGDKSGKAYWSTRDGFGFAEQRPEVYCTEVFAGKERAVNEFRALAATAGHCLAAAGSERLRTALRAEWPLPPEYIWRASFEGQEHLRWVLALYHLAWRCAEGNALFAGRKTAASLQDAPDIRWLFTYESYEKAMVVAREGSEPACPPEMYYSELPQGVFRASVWDIDLLLGQAAGAGKGEAEDLQPTSHLTSLQVIGSGQVHDGWEALRAILAVATQKVDIEDAHINADVVGLLRAAPDAVALRVLTRKLYEDADPAFRRLAQQRSGKLEVRTTANLHGRRIYVDERAYILEDSIKELASRTASCLVPVDKPTEARRLTEDFERRWVTAGVRIRPKA